MNEEYNISDFWKDMYTYYNRCANDYNMLDKINYPPKKLFDISNLTFRQFLTYFDDLLSYNGFLATGSAIKINELTIEEKKEDGTPSATNLYFRYGEKNNKTQLIAEQGGLTDQEDIRIWAVVQGALKYAQTTGQEKYSTLKPINERSEEYLIIKPQLLFKDGYIDNFVSLYRALWPGKPEEIKEHNTYIKVEDNTYTLPQYGTLTLYANIIDRTEFGEIVQPLPND